MRPFVQARVPWNNVIQSVSAASQPKEFQSLLTGSESSSGRLTSKDDDFVEAAVSQLSKKKEDARSKAFQAITSEDLSDQVSL